MSKNNPTYHEQTDIQNTLKLREILGTLPPFAKDYFRAIEPTTSTKTRISYAYDIRIFFQKIESCNLNTYTERLFYPLFQTGARRRYA